VKDSLPGKKVNASEAPQVFVSRQPAELMLLRGEPKYAPVVFEKQLMWVSNTESDVFRMGRTGSIYFLISGRWFSAPDFAGPWTFATQTTDGTLTKLPIGGAPAPPPAQSSGRRGGRRLKERIVENKKDEMQGYMERAVALIHKYVPPDAALIQKAKDAGRMQVQPAQAGAVRAGFKDFVQAGDAMGIDLDVKALLLSALTISTYLEKKEEAVTLDVRFGALADSTGHAARTTLEAKEKNIRVVVENTGHRPIAR
jgi:hypothetical protein